MDNRRSPAAGERCRQKKDGLCQIVTTARHSETGEQMVVYQVLHGDFDIYVKPLSGFINEIERNDPEKSEPEKGGIKKSAVKKAPSEAVQKESSVNRTLSLQQDSAVEGAKERQPEQEGEALSQAQEMLMEFLDADTYAKKLNILRGMKKYIDTKMVHDIAVCLDIGLDEKPLSEQIMDIESCLKTYARFECSRLR